MPALTKVNITSFAANESHGAVVTIGGTAHKMLRDGTIGEQRIEPITVPTELFLEASTKLLAPQLEAVLEESHEGLRKFLESLEASRDAAISAHKDFIKDTRKLFSMRSKSTVEQIVEVTA